LQKLDSTENIDKEAVQKWIEEYLKLECYKVLKGDDIVSLAVQKKQKILKNALKVMKKILYQKLRHDDALVHTEALLNYLELIFY